MKCSWPIGVLPLVLVLGGVAGCASWDFAKSIPFYEGKAQRPASVMAVWTDTIRHEHGATPTRGFLGRLVFYGPDGVKPVKVEGTLDVYGFLENTDGQPKVKPDKKFAFTAEEFATHHSREKIGPAYSVWLPWDAAGGPRQDISLICRFTPKGGTLIVSEQSRHLLPGPAGPEEALAKNRPQSPAAADRSSGVQQISYQAPADGAMRLGDPSATAAAPSIHTTTIPLPANFRRGSVGPTRSEGNVRHGPTMLESAAAPAGGVASSYPPAALPNGAAVAASLGTESVSGAQHYRPAQTAMLPVASTPPPGATMMAANAPGAVPSPATPSAWSSRPNRWASHATANLPTRTAPQRPSRFAPPSPQAPAGATALQAPDPAWWPPSP